MRVLHLIDQASPEACPTTLAVLRLTIAQLSAPEHEHRVLAIGGEPIRAALDAAGLAADRVTAPYGSAYAVLPALRRRLRGHAADVIHCWSPAAAVAARLLRPNTPRILSLTQPLTAAPNWATRRALRHPGLRAILVLSAAQRERVIAAGLPADRVRIVPPAVDSSLIDPAARVALRREWGVSDDTRVVALLSDPPAAADALRADLGLGLAYETVRGTVAGPSNVLMIRHPDQARRAQSRRMMDNYGAGDLVAQEPRIAAPWRILPACDIALALGEAGAGLSLRWAMAAGLPIVAEQQPVQEEWLAPDQTALLCDRDQTKRLAHRLHEVLLNPGLAASIGAAARDAAQRDASPIFYGEVIREVYRGVS